MTLPQFLSAIRAYRLLDKLIRSDFEILGRLGKEEFQLLWYLNFDRRGCWICLRRWFLHRRGISHHHMFMQTGAPELLPLMHKISRSHSFYCRSSAGTDHWQKSS